MDRSRYKRDSLVFGRLVSLTDGIYSVAITLLVFAIGFPSGDPADLDRQLLSSHGNVLTFFIAVTVLGFYWFSNLHFMRHLEAVDSIFIGLKVIYLGLVAFLPLPISLLDKYSDQVVTVAINITSLLLLSLMELALFARAYNNNLFSSKPPSQVIHYSVFIALIPVVVFSLALPIGVLASPTYALALWILLNLPLRILVERRFGPVAEDPYL